MLQRNPPYTGFTREQIMSKAITKEDMALLEEASEMLHETGCVPGIDGEPVPAESIVPDVNTSRRRLTTQKQSTTQRYGIRLGLR